MLPPAIAVTVANGWILCVAESPNMNVVLDYHQELNVQFKHQNTV